MITEPVWAEFPNLAAQYQVWILDHNGTPLDLLENYETLEYILTANGSGVTEWGSFRITGEASQLPHELFTLDRILSVQRKAAGEDWKVEFEGLHRRREFWFDDNDKEWYRSSGTDLKSLVKRRVIRPDTGQAFFSYSGAFTDAMRQLVRTQAGPLATLPRQMRYLVVEANSAEGAVVTYSTRDEQLSVALETLGGLGAAFDIERVGSVYTFRVYYPRRGQDRRLGHSAFPVVFSITDGNMARPAFSDDRLAEINVVYVAGDGEGASREIVERASVWDAMLDSPWNRIEGFLEASQQTSTAALMAFGDAFLTENRQQLAFGCTAIPTPGCLYGRDWNVGDLITGVYRGESYDLSVDAVEVSLRPDEGETLTPTLRWVPEAL
uniref:Gp28/Gp37-like domain-containing protein n=1 Tax=viral metagenome TaxID=1070528 RepID=A0A6M3J1I9_9ZZZZ